MSNFSYSRFGQPILSADRTEIWAYWKTVGTYQSHTFRFNTLSDLLGGECYEDTPRNRDIYVNFDDTYGYWVAGDGTIQRDFADCDHFIPAPLTGPETIQDAITILIEDNEFQRFFNSHDQSDGSSILEKIIHFQKHNRRQLTQPHEGLPDRKTFNNGFISLRPPKTKQTPKGVSADDRPKNSLNFNGV